VVTPPQVAACRVVLTHGMLVRSATLPNSDREADSADFAFLLFGTAMPTSASSVKRIAVFGAAFALALAFFASSAEANIVVTWSDTGVASSLVGTWAGSWDLTNYGSPSGAPGTSAGSAVGWNTASSADLISLPSATTTSQLRRYTLVNTSVYPGSAFNVTSQTVTQKGGSASGDFLSLLVVSNGSSQDTTIDLPFGYVSGESLSGTMFLTNGTLGTAFGTNLDNGPVVMFNDGVNTITFQAVPEPSTVMCLIAAVPFGLRLLRTRRRTASPKKRTRTLAS
jgi:hypothetical protein